MNELSRVFKAKDRFGAEMEFELVTANLAAETEGERQYKIAYSEALRQGIFPRQALDRIMKQKQMWTEDDERAYKKAVAQVAILQISLHEAEAKGDTAECEKLAKQMSAERAKQWQLFLIQQSVFMHSAEGMAELVKAEAVMACCTRIKATGQRYWKDYNEFVQERDENMNSTVYINVVEVQNKILDELRDKIEEQYPEKKYVKDPRQSMLDREVTEEVEKELAKRKQEALEVDEVEDETKEPQENN